MSAARRTRGPAAPALALLALLVAGLAGCAASGAARPDRPFVVTSGEQLRDLYWRGELTDSEGNRWSIWIVPGIVPPVEGGAEAFRDATDYAAELGDGDFWRNRGEEFENGVEFAYRDALWEFLVEGIGRDYRTATRSIQRNIEQAPFAWIPRIIANALAGYVVKPVLRTAVAPLGVAGGAAYATLVPTGRVGARPVGGVFWAAFAGLAWPTLELAFHQPAWLLSIWNREPDPSQNGDFGMRIIQWGPGGPPEAPQAPPEAKKPPEKAAAATPARGTWSEENHRRAYESDPAYRRGYDYGVERGREAKR